jgi:16S rRNA (uracil1498-N3)-methyltransferase
MPAGRFVVTETALAAGMEIELPAEVAHQARDVLRLRIGDTLTLLDGAGGEYAAEIVALDRRRVAARLGERAAGQTESPARIVLCQGMLKAAKFEWVLQKGTELGVAAFVPLLCERAVKATEEASDSRRRRWDRIIAESLEQCGGSVLPVAHPPTPLLRALASTPAGAVALMPWEEERATTFDAALTQARERAGEAGIHEMRLFIGPEGGFSAGEVALARRNGAVPVTLGPRILRAETAALVTVTLALAALGGLGG